jgi:hypothetical protein
MLGVAIVTNCIDHPKKQVYEEADLLGTNKDVQKQFISRQGIYLQNPATVIIDTGSGNK